MSLFKRTPQPKRTGLTGMDRYALNRTDRAQALDERLQQQEHELVECDQPCSH